MNIKSDWRIVFCLFSVTKSKKFDIFFEHKLFSACLSHSKAVYTYVGAHWNSSAEKFRPPETTDAVSTFWAYFKS